MPASRSARATILAPRSWPSRPAFATTTRILRSMRGSLRRSEDRRLAPDAPDPAKGVAHLAHGGVDAGCVHDRGHEVHVALGVRLQPRERRLDLTRVPTGAHGAHALDLLRLEGRVDAQQLDRRLLLERVPIDPDHDALAALDLALVPEGCLRDLALHEVLLDRGDDAAELCD